MDAYKCDRCGKYYDDSTLSEGPALCESKNGRLLDLCEECEESLVKWLGSFKYEKTYGSRDQNDCGYPKHIEGFIKSCSFTIIIHHYHGPIAIKYITIKRFIEALKEYFDYKWNEDDFCMPVGSPSEAKLEEFIYYTLTDYDNLYVSDLSTTRDCIVSKECAIAAFKRYFDYEWDDEIYDKY